MFTDIRLLPFHRSWERGCYLPWYSISERLGPSPWERPSWVTKLSKVFLSFCKVFNTSQRDAAIYYMFSKVNAKKTEGEVSLFTTARISPLFLMYLFPYIVCIHKTDASFRNFSWWPHILFISITNIFYFSFTITYDFFQF